jgi:magnesium-transporting ATPase (P-type)
MFLPVFPFAGNPLYPDLASAAGTAYLGPWIDTAVILVVVVINAFIGFIQEGRAGLVVFNTIYSVI